MSALLSTPDVTVFSYDIENACPYYFNNNKSRDGILKGSDEDDYYVWQAARATSAAPTFFPAADFPKPGQKPRAFIDGGIFINNPTLELLIRAKELYPQSPSILLVSLGTGEFSKSYSNLKKAGVKDWIWFGAPLLNVMMSSVSAAINEQLEKIKGQFPGLTYQRYQKRFANDIGMDDIKPEIIAKLQQYCGGMDGQVNPCDLWWQQVKNYATLAMERVAHGVDSVKQFLSTLTSDERSCVMMAIDEAQPQVFEELTTVAPDWGTWME